MWTDVVSQAVWTKATATALVIVGLSIAHAEEPLIMTLACRGTAIDTTKRDSIAEPFSMGMIVNFRARSIAGFTYPSVDAFPVKITASNNVTIAFSGSNKHGSRIISGSLDRVTGDLEATSVVLNETSHNIVSGTGNLLKCRRAKRML